jgi:aryl-alcohol dehydrogenase-like predicted oxidoreductase
MRKRKLGKTGLEVAPLALGGNVFGWTADEKTSFSLLDAFVDAGFNLIDTADSYSRWATGHQGGESETVIGKWIAQRGRYDDVIIATKVGSDMGQGHKVLRRDYIIEACEASLRRLRVERIDLYQSHWDDENTPFEETLAAYEKLMSEGKVAEIGASNLTAARLAQSLEVAGEMKLPRYQTLQPHYNLYERGSFEGELQALCVRENLGVITYFSLAAGFLTGKYRS